MGRFVGGVLNMGEIHHEEYGKSNLHYLQLNALLFQQY